MTEINIETFFNKLEEIKDALSAVKTDLEVLKDKDHASRINDLSDEITRVEEKLREDVRALHQQHKEHMADYHSSKNFLSKWAVYLAAICALATILVPFIEKIIK